MAFGLETGPDTVVNIKVIGVAAAATMWSTAWSAAAPKVWTLWR